MSEAEIVDLVRRSAISFIGTITQLGAATVIELPVDDHTAIVAVEQVLLAPSTFMSLSGSNVTLQLQPSVDVLPVGQRMAFFANPLTFAQTLGLAEVGRLPADDVGPYVAAAAATRAPAPLSGFQQQLETERLQEHAASADAVVVGEVISLAKSGPSRPTEHDPDWWQATLDVRHVERGEVPTGPLPVLYANSNDVRWYDTPKPVAGQRGVWILHATSGALRELAPFQLADADDYQHLQQLDQLRTSPG